MEHIKKVGNEQDLSSYVKKLKKFTNWIIGVLCVYSLAFTAFGVLLVTETLVVYAPQDYTTENQGLVLYDFYNVTFTDSLLTDLETFWETSGENEFGVCLKTDLNSHTSDEGMSMSDVVFYDIESYKDGHVNYVNMPICDGIAALHKHPNGMCQQSVTDMQWFKNRYNRDGLAFSIVMCGPSKFGVHSFHNIGETYVYEVET